MLIQKLKDGISRFKAKTAKGRDKRRKALMDFAWNRLLTIRIVLFLTGYLWILLLPLLELGQNIYIDENALQPAQVNTYWNWAEVHRADTYLRELETLRDINATSEMRSKYLRDEFSKLGIPAAIQNYAFNTSTGQTSGSNAYAILPSPRSSGAETIVISASWVSRINDGKGALNLRGISTVLSLAAFLKQYSLWAKDLAFVVSDGYLDGMQAWINAYHGHPQDNMEAEPLQISSGTIWTALNIDYPCHSFSHLGVFFEGSNGRLPNQDLINSLHRVSTRTGGVPFVVYDQLDPHEYPFKANELVWIPSWLPSGLKNDRRVIDYAYRAKNLLRHFGYQSRGKPSGVHGLLHRFRIDAITVFAVPAVGPHGFHAIGRIIESTLRTTNNLLERLHASFFFYLLPTPASFMKIGFYLPSVVIISTSMMFGGLGVWVRAGWKQVPTEKPGSTVQWERRARPAIRAISIMVATHVIGLCLFLLTSTKFYLQNQTPVFGIMVGTVSTMTTLIATIHTKTTVPESAPTSTLLKALNLCFASTVISVTSVLNFSLAALLAVLLGVPLSLSRSSSSPAVRLIQRFLYVMLASCWLWEQNQVSQAIWDWEVLGVWFAPFMAIVYTPLVLQAVVVAQLPP